MDEKLTKVMSIGMIISVSMILFYFIYIAIKPTKKSPFINKQGDLSCRVCFSGNYGNSAWYCSPYLIIKAVDEGGGTLYNLEENKEITVIQNNGRCILVENKHSYITSEKKKLFAKNRQISTSSIQFIPKGTYQFIKKSKQELHEILEKSRKH